MICITEIIIEDEATKEAIAKIELNEENVFDVTIAKQPFTVETWIEFAEEVTRALKLMGDQK